ncbi:hypothetical protein LCGC14_2382760 [marine sediment metagenome]|uniref:Uncharacterized protein n=1 Tax=marine sediment metagenome TaxID=412755 RepID=A0A0F9ECT2_9ZZZZ
MGRNRKYNGNTKSVSIKLDEIEQSVLNEAMDDLGYKTASDIFRLCFHDYLSFYFNQPSKEDSS